MRDFFPIVSGLGEHLLAMRRGKLVRSTGAAEVKAVVMCALVSPTPGHDLAVMFGVPDHVLEAWHAEAKVMLSSATLYPVPPVEDGPRLFDTEERKAPTGPAQGLVA